MQPSTKKARRASQKTSQTSLHSKRKRLFQWVDNFCFNVLIKNSSSPAWTNVIPMPNVIDGCRQENILPLFFAFYAGISCLNCRNGKQPSSGINRAASKRKNLRNTNINCRGNPLGVPIMGALTLGRPYIKKKIPQITSLKIS